MRDRYLSQILRDIRVALPDTISYIVFKDFWQQKLPPFIVKFISGLEGSLEYLKKLTDLVSEANNSGHEIHVTADSGGDRLRLIESAILTLNTQVINLLTTESRIDTRMARRIGRIAIFPIGFIQNSGQVR